MDLYLIHGRLHSHTTCPLVQKSALMVPQAYAPSKKSLYYLLNHVLTRLEGPNDRVFVKIHTRLLSALAVDCKIIACAGDISFIIPSSVILISRCLEISFYARLVFTLFSTSYRSLNELQELPPSRSVALYQNDERVKRRKRVRTLIGSKTRRLCGSHTQSRDGRRKGRGRRVLGCTRPGVGG